MEIKMIYKTEDDYNNELESLKERYGVNIISASSISKLIHIEIDDILETITPKNFSDTSKGRWVWARMKDGLRTVTWNWTSQKEFMLIIIGDIIRITANASKQEGDWKLNISTQNINYELIDNDKNMINDHIEDWKSANGIMNKTLEWINTGVFEFITL